MDTSGKEIDKSEAKNINEGIELMFNQTLKEVELHLKNIENKINIQNQKAKSKLKIKNKIGAKRILSDKKYIWI